MSGDARNVEAIHRLTPTQEGILLHAERAPEAGAYLQQFTARLVGPLDAERLRAAWEHVTARHGALRSLFTWRGRPHPLQVVRARVDVPFELPADASLAADDDRFEAFLREDRRRGLELGVAPPQRVTLAREGLERHRLLWTFHHVALDGWSMRRALDEVLRAYADLGAGRAPGSNLAPTQAAYVAWLAARPTEPAREYWRERLAGLEGPTELATARAADGAGHVERSLRLTPERTAALAAVARRERVTPAVLLRAAWALTLSAFSGDEDVVFGATVSGRDADLDGIEGLVGMLIRTVPVRARLAWEAPVGEWLRQLLAEQLADSEHDALPLVDVQRASPLAPGAALFESILVVENHAAVGPAPEGAPRVEGGRFVEHSHYPLAVLAVPGEALELVLIHDRARVSSETAAALHGRLAHVLDLLASDDARTVGALLAPADEERARLARAARGPAFGRAAADAQATVVERFLAAAAAAPEAPAILTATDTLTYAELRSRVATLSTALRARGVAAGDRVALLAPRSADAVTAVFAVLHAGAAYVPLDPDAPAPRVAALLDAAGATLVLTTREDRAGLPDGAPPALAIAEAAAGPDDGAASAARAEGLAYVLFTSGSTGSPKGVEIKHDALARSTAARQPFYGAPPERFLLLSPLHFDSSVAGLFWTLTGGGTLVLPEPGGERDVRAVAALVRRHAVTHTLLLPSLHELLLEVAAPDELASLAVVAVAGEATPGALVARHHAALSGARLVNEYGPTEATVWATAQELTADDVADPVPIGRPVGDVLAVVLDARGRPTPPGVAGELHLAGPTLARGYAADAPRTSERFVTRDPFSEGPAPWYRTGDRVRQRSDAALEFLGRADGQVKVRGHRVELGEVEACVEGHPHVREAAARAVPAPDGRGLQLAVYAVPASGGPAPAAEDLRAHMAARLPAAFVPTHVVLLQDLPRTPTGKVDRAALPAPDPARNRAAALVAPRNDTEATLAALWRDVLGLPEVSVEADFFELGGDSLLSIRIIARAHKAGLAVEPARFAERPTIAGMALAARGADVSATPADEAGAALPLTPIQAWFLGLELPARDHWNLARLIEVPATDPPERVEAALAALVAAHDALRLAFAPADGAEPPIAQRVVATVPFALERVDLTSCAPAEREATLARAADAAQASLDLAAGRVMAARLFELGPGAPRRLLLVVHHLAVDAASWGTLEDDLADALAELRAGRDARVAPPTTSFGAWARALAAHGASPALARHAPRWLALERTTLPPLPRDREGPNDVDAERTFDVALGAERTRELLEDVPSVYGTRVQEVLLTALARALARWTDGAAPLVDVEGHGREVPGLTLDVSRTVGWFTAVWPLVLALPGGARGEPGAALKAVKEAARSAAEAGPSLGLLRRFSPDAELRARLAALPAPEVLFNHLGHGPGPDAGPVGACRGSGGRRAYALEINSWVVDGALRARWSFAETLNDEGTIAAVARSFVEELEELLDHCRSPAAGGRTPSDFPLAGLDQAELDRLGDLLGGG